MRTGRQRRISGRKRKRRWSAGKQKRYEDWLSRCTNADNSRTRRPRNRSSLWELFSPVFKPLSNRCGMWLAVEQGPDCNDNVIQAIHSLDDNLAFVHFIGLIAAYTSLRPFSRCFSTCWSSRYPIAGVYMASSSYARFPS